MLHLRDGGPALWPHAMQEVCVIFMASLSTEHSFPPCGAQATDDGKKIVFEVREDRQIDLTNGCVDRHGSIALRTLVCTSIRYSSGIVKLLWSTRLFSSCCVRNHFLILPAHCPIYVFQPRSDWLSQQVYIGPNQAALSMPGSCLSKQMMFGRVLRVYRIPT